MAEEGQDPNGQHPVSATADLEIAHDKVRRLITFECSLTSPAHADTARSPRSLLFCAIVSGTGQCPVHLNSWSAH